MDRRESVEHPDHVDEVVADDLGVGKCSRQWDDTQCLRCHEWSPHEAWYG